MHDLVFSSTTELAASIQSGKVSATEVMEAHLAQIDRHNRALNAVVTLEAEAALTRARAADEATARGEVWGPLHGVPFTLKDAHATAGMRTTTGFPPLDHVPPEDGTVAARLKAAGAILLGKTNVHAMLGDPAQTANPIFGRTNNPWDPARTPGGSSGGAAAAVAAGMTPFEIGTDLSGSIRIPAHFCGLFGLKPTEGRVPLTGLIPGLTTPRSVRVMSSIGPLARSVDDLGLLFSIIAGPDGRDTGVPPVPIGEAPRVRLKHLRIAVAPTLPPLPVATDIRIAMESLAGELGQHGATLEEILPAVDVERDLSRAGAIIGMMIGAFQPGQPHSTAQYFEALDHRDRSIQAWEDFFEQWDVLICPPSMTAAFPHCDPGTPLPVNGQEVDYWAVSAHCTLFNYTGHPAVVLPWRLDPAGLPIGIQLVTKRWDESRLLALAAAVAEVSGQFRRPAGY